MDNKSSLKRLQVIETHLNQSPTASSAAATTTTGSRNNVHQDSPKSRHTHNSLHEKYVQWFNSLKVETEYEIEEIEGELPMELEGTYYREGPGLFEVAGVRQHTIDADGMVVTVSIKNGKAYFKNRYVRTEGYVKERIEEGFEKQLYRGGYGTSLKGSGPIDSWWKNTFNFVYKNPANTSLIAWGGLLLVTYELGLPHLVHPETLETLGEFDCYGAINKSAGEVFSAHPRVDSVKDRMINFGLDYRRMILTVWEFDKYFNVIQKHKIKMKFSTVIHSFIITENYLLFPASSVYSKGFDMLIWGKGVDDCIFQDTTKPTLYYLIPRNPNCAPGVVNTKCQIYEGDVLYHNHTLNGWEDKSNGTLVFYATPFSGRPKFDIHDSAYVNPPASLTKFVLTIGNTHKKVTKEIIRPESSEVPTHKPGLDGLPIRYGYFVDLQFKKHQDPKLTIQPWSAIVKVDLHTKEQQVYRPSPQRYMSECFFIPRKNSQSEDDGWTVNLEFDPETNKSNLLIMDARDFNKGPVARLHFKNHVPYTFHGCWLDHYIGPK